MSRAAIAHSAWRQWLAGLFPPALLAIASLIALPVFLIGLPCSHDAFIHLSRAAEVYFNASGGSPFLQWSPDLMRGYGHPVLAFYSPLLYWLLAAPHWLGASFAATFRALAYLALPVGGIGLYVLGRRYLSRPAAFVAGLTYLFAPYLLFDAIQRGALPEAVALAVLPYCLAAIGAAARRRTLRSVVGAGLLLSLLISLHNLVPLFAVPLGLAVAACEGLSAQTPWTRRATLVEAGRGLLAAALAIGLAVVVAASIWLPALVEVKQTLTGQPLPPPSAELSNWPRYYANLIPAAELIRWPAEPGDWQLYNAPISRSLGVAPAIGAALAALALLHPAIWRRFPVLAVLGLAGLVSLFLSSQWSRWLWDHSSQLQVVQLPTRFLGPTNLAVALLCGLLVELLLARAGHPALRAAAVALPAVAIAVCGWPWLFPRYCAAPNMDTPAGIAQPQRPNVWMYEPLGELLPQWVQTVPPEQALTDQYQAGQAVNRLTWPTGTVVQTSWQTRRGDDHFELQVSQPTTVTYQTFYFPGWQATVDGQPTAILPSVPTGLMTVSLPAGSHVLEISFHPTPLRVWTGLVSLAGLALALLAGLRGRRLAEPAPDAPPALAGMDLPLTLGGASASLLLLFFVVLPRINTPIFGQRLQGESLTGLAHPASITFEQEVRYLGFQLPAQIRADQEFELVQYWKAEHALGVPYGFAARVADDQGHSWNLPSDRPFDFGDYLGSEGWPVNAYLRDDYLMRLLPGTPPGNYWLEVNVFRRDNLLQLVPAPGTPTSPDPAWARVGHINVLPPVSAALPANLAVDQVQATQLQPGLDLAGWSLPPAPVLAGDIAHVTLVWQIGAVLSAPASLLAQLRAGDGQTAADFTLMPGGGTGPVTGLVRDQLDWRVPGTTTSGSYQVVVQDGPVTAVLGEIKVKAQAHQFTPPALKTPVDQRLGFARLAGYTLSATSLKPGESLSLAVVWQSIEDTSVSYRVFVHLRGANDLPITQSDNVPADWQRPTSGWVPGEYILDGHTLSLPPDAPTGAYTLVVGLYNPADGSRLGEVTLANIRVP